MPSDSTGISPFELLYGRSVRGPLNVIWELQEASSRSREGVVSMVLSAREMTKMELVQKNVGKVQQCEKAWYDWNARHWDFQPSEQVIVLPTSTDKLIAPWQRSYTMV